MAAATRDLQNLCIETLDEYGIGGGSDGFDVSTDNDEHKRFLKWMIAAIMYVDNLHTDWRYLWVDWTGDTLAAASSQLVIPTVATFGEVNQWVKGSLWLDRGTSDPLELTFHDWQTFRKTFLAGTIQTADPQFYSIAPDNTIYFDSKTRKTHTPSGEFHRRTAELSADDDEPLAPYNHRRIYQVKAVLNYGMREDAPEILGGEAAEYDDLLEKLRQAELPGYRTSGISENEDEDIVTVVE